MVKNLKIYGNSGINKLIIHKLIRLLKGELNFTITNLEISFVNSADIIQLNKKYLNHNRSTDIITFCYSKIKSSLEGEILISLDDAFQNSKVFKTTFKKELLRLITHGILHLLGYNDKKMNEKKVMKKKENQLVNKYRFILR